MSIWMLLISASSLKKKKKGFHGLNFIAKLIRASEATVGGVVSLGYSATHTGFDTVSPLHISLLWSSKSLSKDIKVNRESLF